MRLGLRGGLLGSGRRLALLLGRRLLLLGLRRRRLLLRLLGVLAVLALVRGVAGLARALVGGVVLLVLGVGVVGRVGAPVASEDGGPAVAVAHRSARDQLRHGEDRCPDEEGQDGGHGHDLHREAPADGARRVAVAAGLVVADRRLAGGSLVAGNRLAVVVQGRGGLIPTPLLRPRVA